MRVGYRPFRKSKKNVAGGEFRAGCRLHYIDPSLNLPQLVTLSLLSGVQHVAQAFLSVSGPAVRAIIMTISETTTKLLTHTSPHRMS